MSVAVDVLLPTVRDDGAAQAVGSAIRAAGADIDLRVHVQPDPLRRGPAWARNRAAELGNAPFLALLDDDDRWFPGRLIGALQLLRERPEIALVCGDALPAGGGRLLAADPRGSGRVRAAIPGDRTHEDLVLDCFVVASTVTLRREDWERVGGMDETLARAEDYGLWLRLTADGALAHLLPDALARYGVERSGPSLSDDAEAHALDSLAALTRWARPDLLDRRNVRARLGVLSATLALQAARRSDVVLARSRARRALADAPWSPMTWKALLACAAPGGP